MKVPNLVLGIIAGGAALAAVASARAQAPRAAGASAAAQTPTMRYEYHVLNLGWGSAEVAESIFNGLGKDGWHVVAQAGAYVTFERPLASPRSP